MWSNKISANIKNRRNICDFFVVRYKVTKKYKKYNAKLNIDRVKKCNIKSKCEKNKKQKRRENMLMAGSLGVVEREREREHTFKQRK